MEAVPGGLSGGGYNSNEENSAARIGHCPSSVIAAPLHAGAITWAGFVPNIESGRLTSFWQHECDEGMFIEPHCCAMCLQQSRSALVISAPGIRHAITGRPDRTISNRTLARWRIIFTSEPVYAHFWGEAFEDCNHPRHLPAVRTGKQERAVGKMEMVAARRRAQFAHIKPDVVN